ncbi:hypothetical protein C2845_PM13G08420 [Panicum miliaceum]|uniref:Uncharacterized protein n=1 Tax=Panicum miliaceum TaxID=4540 RepID=A0A3L6REJ4_PANMI|nr:hypothetical protein C2845_PM13G08420 [Panicum miliaceum]
MQLEEVKDTHVVNTGTGAVRMAVCRLYLNVDTMGALLPKQFGYSSVHSFRSHHVDRTTRVKP